MVSKRLAPVSIVLGLMVAQLVVPIQSSSAQSMVTSAPLQRIGSGYYEQSGARWSLRGPNFFATSGGGVLPQFGNPGAGFSSGFGFGGGGGLSGSLAFNFAQGSGQSITSTTPSITTMNGFPGAISSGTIRPFVTGVTPVVGGYSYGQPVTENFSNQMFDAYQQAQARQLRQRAQASVDAQQRRAEEAFRRGMAAESDGDLKMARANYRKALSVDQGPLRDQIIEKMRARGWK
ncbi:MAG: hypothetical protein KDB00_17065 [Planctomycetales bacterium]|nr:hypothetical protein [Planctomycetales bacterium]